MSDQVINEAYFGKSNKIVKIEKLIGRIRSKFKDSYMKYNIEGSEEWQELKEAFEDAFGFYSLTLLLGRSGIPNAFTVPISLSLDRVHEIQNKVRLSKISGLKFDPKDKFCTLITIEEELLFNFEFTDGEITAILLHEVGHNFQTVGYNHLVMLAFIDSIFNFLIGLQRGDISGLILFEPIRRVALGSINSLQGTAVYNVLDVISKVARFPMQIAIKMAYPLLKMFQFIQYTSIVLMAPLLAYCITFNGYAKENFADKYPVMLGYGPEYSSAMGKLNTAINNIGALWAINRIPIISHLYQFLLASVTFLGIAIDPHPEYSARVMAIVKTLEHDLNDRRLDPKARKQIKEDLARVKKNIQTYLDNPMSSGDEVAITYQKWLMEKFPGYGDIRSKMLKDSDIDDTTIDKNFKELQKVKENTDIDQYPGIKEMCESFEYPEYDDCSVTETIIEAYVKGYIAGLENYGNIKYDTLHESIIDDIQGWYRRRLTSEELEEAKKELRGILGKVRIPDVKPVIKIFSKEIGNKQAALKVSEKFVHIIDKNGIADFTIIDSFAMTDQGKHTITGINKVNEVMKKINTNSKKYKYFVTRDITSTNNTGFVGVIYAYRRKDKVTKSELSDKVEGLNKQTIIVY